MASELKAGIITGLVIYTIGILFTVATHLIFGWENRHSPPASTIPFLLTFLVGGFRLLWSMLGVIFKKSLRAKGELFVHVGIVTSFLIFIAWIVINYEAAD